MIVGVTKISFCPPFCAPPCKLVRCIRLFLPTRMRSFFRGGGEQDLIGRASTRPPWPPSFDRNSFHSSVLTSIGVRNGKLKSLDLDTDRASLDILFLSTVNWSRLRVRHSRPASCLRQDSRLITKWAGAGRRTAPAISGPRAGYTEQARWRCLSRPGVLYQSERSPNTPDWAAGNCNNIHYTVSGKEEAKKLEE